MSRFCSSRVSFVRTCGRAGVLHAACVVNHAIETFEITGHELPRPHVPRFFLTPDQVNAGTVASQNVDDTLFRERIEFFDADDRDVFASQRGRRRDRSRPCRYKRRPCARGESSVSPMTSPQKPPVNSAKLETGRQAWSTAAAGDNTSGLAWWSLSTRRMWKY